MDRTRRTQGFVPITAMGARRKYPRGSSTTITNLGGRTPRAYEFDSGDFTTDGTLEYVDVNHGIGNTAVLYQCFNQDGDDVWPEGAHRYADYVRIWFGKAYTHLTVVLL